MPNWSTLWNYRNEPVLALLSLAVLGLVVMTIVLLLWQVLFRAAPLICNDTWLPASSEECREFGGNTSTTGNFPVGTILPFFGRDEDIPDGWVVCDGESLKGGNFAFNFDADPKKGGIQVPDLRGKFIRGANSNLREKRINVGGSETIDLEHRHMWAETRKGRWHSYKSNAWQGVDDWGDGIGNEGGGYWPLNNRGSVKLYTKLGLEGKKPDDTLPPYFDLRYIIRVR